MARAAVPTPLLAGVTLVLATLILLAAAPRAVAAEATCPSTFHVLHDDRVGELVLPEGHYEITLLDDSQLSCAAASDLFRQFLERYTGDLPGRWIVDAARAEFRRGDTGAGFRVARVGTPSGGGGGHHPASRTHCPGFFTVLHNDRVGALRLPGGEYRITLLASGRLTCERAARLLGRFLELYDGNLPGRWRVDEATATFSRAHHVGFRVKRAVGTPPDPTPAGTHPAQGQRRCSASFRVLHDDRIGRLRLRRGNHRITVFGGLSCSRASALLTRFLDRFEGDLPGRWRLNPNRATFQRGSRGFRVKRARPA